MRAIIDDIASIFRSDPWTEWRREYAGNSGWAFEQRRRFGRDLADYTGFSLFQGKMRFRRLGVMERTLQGGEIRIYDLVRYTDFKKREVTVFEFRHPNVEFPPFTIHPKGTWGKLKGIFIVDDLMMPTTPDFNAHYTINTNDPKDLREDLNIEFLDLVGDEAGWTYEGRGPLMIAYRPGTVLPPDRLPFQIDRFHEMCRLLLPAEQ